VVILGLVVALYLGIGSFRAFEHHEWLMFALLFLGMQVGGLLMLYAGIRLIRKR
jgi:hypothetical protein